MSSFNDFGLSSAMRSNLDQLGFSQPTEIQAKALAPGLAGKDIIAMAKTGSGKTAAFGISLVEKLNPRLFAVQALVLCPTRELADQVAKAIRELARARDNIKVLTLCGGVAIGPQIGSLSHGAHIVVGTADRMLDMGFQEAMEDILSHTPSSRQTMMFSATWPAPIRELSKQYQKSPVDVRAEETGENPDIEELFYEVSPQSKSDAIVALLSERQPESCIVFCTTKQQCDELAQELGERGFSALPLHGDLEQRDRDSVLVRFGNQSCSILVATDVAARGLDIKSLPLVINAEPARDPEVHTHRIGRTGRAGEQGHAVTFCTPAQGHKISRIESERRRTVEWGDTEALLATPLKPVTPAMKTLCIAGGRKDKIRPGDVMGALTGEAGLPGKAVGKIDLFDHQCFVAVEKSLAGKALSRLENGKVKGRKIRVRYA